MSLILIICNFDSSTKIFLKKKLHYNASRDIYSHLLWRASKAIKQNFCTKQKFIFQQHLLPVTINNSVQNISKGIIPILRKYCEKL